MLRLLTALLLLSLAGNASALERLDISKVPSNKLTRETQKTIPTKDSSVHLAWYVPTEFWQASLSKGSSDKGGSDAGGKKFLDTFRPYFMVVVVQADISDFGSFRFYSREQVAKHLSVVYEDGNGRKTTLQPVEPSADADMMLNMMRPIFTGAVGNLGSNLHFFFFSDTKGAGRVVDPYLPGNLIVNLQSSKGAPLTAKVEMPLDSLYAPRLCPNGKEAHVSWKYCPWGGERLPE